MCPSELVEDNARVVVGGHHLISLLALTCKVTTLSHTHTHTHTTCTGTQYIHALQTELVEDF